MIRSLLPLLLLAAAPLAAEPREPMRGLIGNTVLGTDKVGTNIYVFRADNSYFARFPDGTEHAGWWRADAGNLCFFQVLPGRADDIGGCFPQSGQERLGGVWTIDGETMRVVAGVDPALMRHGFVALTGGADDPMTALYGKRLVSAGGTNGSFILSRDHSYRFMASDGTLHSGGWALTKRQLCLYQLRPRGLGEKPVPCIADIGQLPAGRWKKDGVSYRIEPRIAVNEIAAPALLADITRLAAPAGGTFGVAALHLETGRMIALNGDASFGAGSTFKLPVAVQALQMVDAGRLSLDRMIPLETGDIVPYGTISTTFRHQDVILSLANYLEAMLTISDNSAADLVLRTVGGPAAHTGWATAAGYPGLKVFRSTADAYRFIFSLPNAEPGVSLSDQIDALAGNRANPDDALTLIDMGRAEASPNFTATPEAMVRLLNEVWTGDMLTPDSAALLRAMMDRCETGPGRLKGQLPKGTPIAHKTGTDGYSVNDVGVITLPNNKGHIAIAVLSNGQTGKEAVSEAAIAGIGRAVHDWFVAN